MALHLFQKTQAVVFAFMKLVIWVMHNIDHDMDFLTYQSLWLA
jgi:hypothetical protein